MDTIADMTEALATFFRYTISKVENLVSVEEELQNCETYFHIQRYRFADPGWSCTSAVTPADREAIYRCRLPKLTIQPIVENSIIHGTELKLGTGHIRIQLERTQKRLLIRISDDGVGMDAETLLRLNERLGKSAIAQPPQSRGRTGAGQRGQPHPPALWRQVRPARLFHAGRGHGCGNHPAHDRQRP